MYAPGQEHIDIEKAIRSYCALKGYDADIICQKVTQSLSQIKASKEKNLKAFARFVRHNTNLQKAELIEIARSSFSLLPEEIAQLNLL